MRYILIFGITLILTLLLLFYHPYLYVYKDTITISFDDELEEYSWNYNIDNDNIIIDKEKDNSWVFKVNKNGLTNLYFTYSNNDDVKYTIYYKLRVIGNRVFWLEGYGNGLLDYPNPT